MSRKQRRNAAIIGFPLYVGAFGLSAHLLIPGHPTIGALCGYVAGTVYVIAATNWVQSAGDLS